MSNILSKNTIRTYCFKMVFQIIDKEKLRKIGILCPVCEGARVTTRVRDNMRRCERCGEEWPKYPPKVEAEE